MTASTTAHNSALCAKDVQKIASLARVQIEPHLANDYATSLNNILTLMQRLAAIDTEHVIPMASPHDNAQPLRPDVVTQTQPREQFLAIAPATQDGLYLVPRVIE